MGARNIEPRASSSSARADKSSAKARPPGFATKASRRRRWKAASKPGERPASPWCAPTSCHLVTSKGRTVWVTRVRPKVDRIACPWLIRRFIDPNAVFLFVLPSEVTAVAERFSATPFDIESVFWSHRGETCTFDTMIEEFGLRSEPLLQLGQDRSWRGYGPPRSYAAVGWIAGRVARLLAHVSGRSCAARGGHGALRCILSLVPRRRRRDPQLAQQQAGSLT